MKSRLHSSLATCAAILAVGLAPAAAAQEDVYVDAGRGPVAVHVPALYSSTRPAPLVLILHGYGANADFEERYVKLTPLSDAAGFLLALPDGRENPLGKRYWNATNACCDYFGNSDDSGYLLALIDTIAATLNVDPRRILVFGHSNGGFMAHRMACDHADVVAAVASFGGASWLHAANCNPVQPVNVLEVHGTADANIFYGGGCMLFLGCYPSAATTIEQWAQFNHCSAGAVLPQWLDLTADVAGAETMAYSFDSCDPGGSATLLAVVGGGHVPELSPSFNDVIVEYLLSHPRPSTIPCEDVEALEASCEDDGTLVATLRLADSEYRSETVDFKIDGVIQAARIVRTRASAVLGDQAPGSHRVSLVAPAGCAQPVEVSCGQ